MRKLFGLATIIVTFFLVACDADPALVAQTTPGDTGGTGGTGDPGVVDDSRFIGSGTGAGFQNGVILASQTALQAGGTASLTVNFVDVNNNLVPDDITVNFSSLCAGLGFASIVETSVQTNIGVASAAYTATGCSGDDEITATANVNSIILTATVTLNIASAPVGSIDFISAEPVNIGLLGTGGVGRQETATVQFSVTDASGGPVAGATVDFSLNTTIGGIDLTPTSATSDVSGLVQTVVSAGSVATSVRVTATVNPSSPVIATQSDQLTITTGIPDDDSVSLSFGCVNLEAWNFDGVATDVTVRLSDRYNNPVPDDTAVTLSAEGGQVGGSCVTSTTPQNGGGVCTVTWVSQDPRPLNGRVTVMATAIGEESFVDVDADGRFNGTDIAIPIGEPFRDDNESLTYDIGEVFSDFNVNGLRDDANQPDYLGFNGLLCDDPLAPAAPICSANDTLFVSDQNIVLMSSSNALMFDNVGGDVMVVGVQIITVTIGDNKNNGTTSQPMPGGSVVSATTSNGTMVGPTTFPYPCSNFNGPLSFTFAIEADSTPDSGVMVVEIETPSGFITAHTITIRD